MNNMLKKRTHCPGLGGFLIAAMFCLVWFLGWPSHGNDAHSELHGDDAAPPMSVHDLIERLEEATRESDRSTLREIMSLIATGEGGVPAIRDAVVVALAQKDYKLVQHLLTALNQIPGSDAVRVLYDVVFSDPGDSALMGTWARRLLAGRNIDWPIPAEDLGRMLELIKRGGVVGEDMALVLSRCDHVSVAERATPILNRFLSGAKQIDGPPSPRHGSSVSAQATNLIVLMMALRNIGDGAIPIVKSYHEQEEDAYTRKWLTLARGSVGDSTVADAVHSILISDEDISVRTAAVMAFASSLGEEAMPVLSQLTLDKTESPFRSSTAYLPHPIADMARSELHRLKEKRETAPVSSQVSARVH